MFNAVTCLFYDQEIQRGGEIPTMERRERKKEEQQEEEEEEGEEPFVQTGIKNQLGAAECM